jgi:hypothetical protein
MSSNAGLTLRFGGDTSELNSAVEKAKSLISSFGESIKTTFAGIDTKGATDAIGAIGDKAMTSSDGTKGAFGTMKEDVEKASGAIGAAVVAATAYLMIIGEMAVAAVAPIKDAAGAFDQTTQSMSAIKSVADRSGLSLDGLGKSFFDLQKKAKDGDDAVVHALNAIGLSAKDVTGLTQDQLAVKMASAFSSARDSANKAAVGVALFGDSAAKLVPQLNRGAATVLDLEAAANRAGVSIGPDLAAKVASTQEVFAAFTDRINELKATVEGGLLQQFQQFKPAIDGIISAFTDVARNITDLVEWFNDLNGAGQRNIQTMGLMATAAQYFAQIIAQATFYVQDFAVQGIQYLDSLGVSFKGLSAVAVAVGEDIKAMASNAASALYTAFREAIGGVIQLFGDLARAGASALSFDFSGARSNFAAFGNDASGVGSKIKTALSTITPNNTIAAFGQMRSAAQQESAALDKVTDRLKAQRDAQLALIAAGGAKGAAPGKKAVGDPTVPDTDKGSGKGDNEALQTAMKQIEGQIEAVKAAYNQKKAIYEEDQKLLIMSESQKTAATKAALDQEYAAEKELLQKELALDGMKPSQKQEINNKLTQLDAKYAADTQKLNAEAAEKMAGTWNKMVDAVSSDFSSGIMGMLERSKSLVQVLQSVARTIVSEFVKMGVDIVANWVKSQIGMTVANATGQTQLVAAATAAQGQITATTAAGQAARNAVTTTGALVQGTVNQVQVVAPVVAGQATMTTATLAGEAARTSAAAAGAGAQASTAIAGLAATLKVDFDAVVGGVAAFLAPLFGPAAVPMAFGVAGSIPAFDIGAYNLPGDTLAMVHRNELVMPAAQAGAFRNMLENGGAGGAGSGGDTHYHTWNNTINGARGPEDVVSQLKRNGKAIGRAFAEARRHGNFNGIR